MFLIQPSAKTAYRLQAANKKMQNEPNLKNTKMNLNPFKTKKYEKNQAFARRQNEPNLRQNEPNSNQSNAVMACSSATLLTYSGQTLRKKCCASSSLRPKQQTFSKTRATCETNPKRTQFTPIQTQFAKKTRKFMP